MNEEKTEEQEEHAEEEGASTDEEEQEDGEPQPIDLSSLAEMVRASIEGEAEPSLEDLRCVGLYGDIDEEKAAETIVGLLSLHHLGKPKLPEEGEEQEPGKPIDLYISTYGGSADEMASLVDVINLIKKDCPVRTIGIGKVMSAGVLVLASGTKGERIIGKNCRVMIHSVIGGHSGALHNLENELTEIKKMQEVYIDSLVKETKMTKKQIKSFMRRKTNVYLTAEEAIEYGIADKILE